MGTMSKVFMLMIACLERVRPVYLEARRSRVSKVRVVLEVFGEMLGRHYRCRKYLYVSMSKTGRVHASVESGNGTSSIRVSDSTPSFSTFLKG